MEKLAHLLSTQTVQVAYKPRTFEQPLEIVIKFRHLEPWLPSTVLSNTTTGVGETELAQKWSKSL